MKDKTYYNIKKCRQEIWGWENEGRKGLWFQGAYLRVVLVTGPLLDGHSQLGSELLCSEQIQYSRYLCNNKPSTQVKLVLKIKSVKWLFWVLRKQALNDTGLCCQQHPYSIYKNGILTRFLMSFSAHLEHSASSRKEPNNIVSTMSVKMFLGLWQSGLIQV